MLKQTLQRQIKQLNSQEIQERLLAINQLEQITKTHPSHHWYIMEALSNFLRQSAPIDNLDIICIDIQTALHVICNRNVQHDPKNQILDLSFTNIPNVNLDNTNLQQINFYQSNLTNASLKNANLHQAILAAANLKGANLERANLSSANLGAANLTNANLRAANLHRANLYLANLEGAIVQEANLWEANLREANFKGVRQPLNS
ncbi:pentapeptide repeat-containing protein [Calothrix sp. PCC 6303]|uniref:pentapeptide repeat-containing protein n=1 Tax=Calothrix sp. PCC 6303 TaxID=1170562 RepID=UPI0002A02A5E|nr:pentapeptide repeat-containing protein [Calothrix sp. PCC 6303]AFZ02301.1 pentapeptide repeat protein [Calothrix sp. PCC 6303]